jgi:predicted metal-binding protein
MPATRELLDPIILQNGFSEYKWINPKEIIVSHWVRIKCLYGCGDYGQGACPPNTPEVDECSRFIKEYDRGVIFRFNQFADKNNYPAEWAKMVTEKLLALEREVFLKGFYKVFLLNHACCNLCKSCEGTRVDCKDKLRSRPSAESFAVDVYRTARNAGMDINVVAENPSEMTKIAILLIE